MAKRDFLFELGTEELPPKSLFTLAQALADGVAKGLATAAIAHGEIEWFATPRRLAVRVHGVAERQPDQEIKRQGPAVANAFDASGAADQGAAGFAASCGVGVDELQQVDGPKGRVLMFVGTKKGEPTAALLPGIVKAALDALPIAKRMRWGAGERSSCGPCTGPSCCSARLSSSARFSACARASTRAGIASTRPAPLPIASPAKYVRGAEEGSRRGGLRRATRADPQRSGGARTVERRSRCDRGRACSMK